jgi:uncharacterized membrane protein
MAVRSAADTAVDVADDHRVRWRVGGRRLPRSLPRHVWGAGLLSLGAGGAQAAIGVQQYRQFRLGGYDLVIFDQAIRGYARFGMPVSQMKDTHNPGQALAGYGHSFSILGDHFSPTLALLAPLYWIWNNPQVLILAEAALFACAVPFVWLFTRRALGSPAIAYLVAFAFGICWELQEASAAGFHEVGFFVPLCALMLERYQAGKLRQAMIVAAALLLVKEDAGYVVAMFGLVVLIGRGRTRRQRWGGAGLLAGGVLEAQLVLHLWIPALGGRSDYYWYWTQLSTTPSMKNAALKVVLHPAYAMQVATTPSVKVSTFWWLVVPLLFMCFFSPLVLLAAPLAAERAFSDDPGHWGLGPQYNAFLAPILILAAVDGARRLNALWGRTGLPLEHRARVAKYVVGTWALFLAVTMAWTSWTMFPLGQVLRPSGWQTDAIQHAQTAAVAMIPDGADVEADDDASTHLTSRTDVVLLDQTPHLRDWVVLQDFATEFPLTRDQLRARVTWLLAHGYRQVFEQDDVYVFHKMS